MPEEVTWSLEAHTKAKHELLRKYLGAWFPILALSNQRVMFLDGFAGPGIYADGERGSPILALDTLVSHAHFDRMQGTEFVFLFVEADLKRFANLEQEIERYWSSRSGGKPNNVVVKLNNAEFAVVANDLVALSREKNRQLVPTFAFIDPFGFSGVPLLLIKELLASDKCEVLFNFMYDSVNRFVTATDLRVAQHFAELFGTQEAEYEAAAELSGKDRKQFLIELYMKQLRDIGGFKYVWSFEMIDAPRNRTTYYLMFGTRHRKGLEAMKDAMWSLDPVAGVRFRSSADDQPMLFSPEPDFGPLREALLKRFVGNVVAIEDIEQFVIEQTDYKTTHYKKVLQKLETAGTISCESARARRLTYPKGTVLRFDPGRQNG